MLFVFYLTSTSYGQARAEVVLVSPYNSSERRSVGPKSHHCPRGAFTQPNYNTGLTSS